MPFIRADVEDLLVRCHRRCCICHRFCGVKIETDHLLPTDEGGTDDIDNAIPVCFECHADIHSYNDRHPRGRKFQPAELRSHRDQWLGICKQHPELLIAASSRAQVGPLQALIDELDFNLRVSSPDAALGQGCLFQDAQFRRAIHEGAISVLDEALKTAILDAYVAIGRANQQLHLVTMQEPPQSGWDRAMMDAGKAIADAEPRLEAARRALLSCLGSEPEG